MKLIRSFQEKEILFISSGDLEFKENEIRGLSQYFVCAFFLNQLDWDQEQFRRVIKMVIKAGAVYLIFHGNKCGLAHDLADQIKEAFQGVNYDDVIMTTWHENEDIKEVLHFAFTAAWPADKFADKFNAHLIISVGSKKENDYIEGLLKDIETILKDE